MLFFISSSDFRTEDLVALGCAAAFGVLALAHTGNPFFPKALKGDEKKQLPAKSTKTTASKCPFSGAETTSNDDEDEPLKMACPFASQSSNTTTPKKTIGTKLKIYKFNVSQEHLKVIEATLSLVAELDSSFTQHFYKRLFKGNPQLKNLFNQTNQAVGHQPKKLFNKVAEAAVAAIKVGEIPGEAIEAVCQKHVALGVPAEAYGIVGGEILGTIGDLLTKDQTVLDAWGALYGEVANIFIEREAEIRAGIGWQGRRKFHLVKKTAKSETITRFQFRPVDGLPVPTFAAGHYLTVWVKIPGGSSGVHGDFTEQPRHYTLAIETEDDSGVANRTLSISVKRDGLISSILHNASIGSEFDLSSPVGYFDLAPTEKVWLSDNKTTPVVLLSAGVGITPCLAMLESLSEDCPASWLHGAQNGNHHAYCDRIRHLAATRKGGLTTRVWYSCPTEEDGPPGGMESCPSLFNLSKYHFKGRMELTAQSLLSDKFTCPKELLHLKDHRTQYYMCGPGAFMEAQREALEKLGVDASRIHSEGFA